MAKKSRIPKLVKSWKKIRPEKICIFVSLPEGVLRHIPDGRHLDPETEILERLSGNAT